MFSMNFYNKYLLFFCAVLLQIPAFSAPEQPYQKMRQPDFPSSAIPVQNLKLSKDCMEIELQKGELVFAEMAIDQLWLAVFRGNGKFRLDPKDSRERRHLQILTESEILEDSFDKAIFFWSDSSFQDIPKPVAGTAPEWAKNFLESQKNLIRKDSWYNLEMRIFSDLLGKPEEGVFFALLDSKKYRELMFSFDPQGVAPLSYGSEQVAVERLSKTEGGFWYMAARETNGQPALAPFDAEHYKIETRIEGEALHSTTRVRLKANTSGARLIPFSLEPKLKLKNVTLLPDKSALPWIQEAEKELPVVGVTLLQPAQKDQIYEIELSYTGEGVLEEAGEDNFFVDARTNWYPHIVSFEDFSSYELEFCHKKSMQLVATGIRATTKEENCSQWSMETPVKVVGFNYGKFKKRELVDPDTKITIEVYTNKGEIVSGIGSMNTGSMADDALVDTQNALRAYTHYFGPMPFSRIAITQQPSLSFGQAWPTLIYLPISAFLDTTQRASIGMTDPALTDFVHEVGPHEVAHQWWGHLVGWKGYRDQWLSEGFAEFSAGLWVEITQGNKEFEKYWKDKQKTILEKLAGRNMRAFEVGPISMGHRLSTHKSPSAYSRLVYSKGAYVLHMLRMLMQGSKGQDDAFIAMMKDFTSACRLRPCATSDFQKIVEKHMTPDMDLEGNKKMDWFFRQWVHGIEIPTYKLQYQTKSAGAGKTQLTGTLQQTGVSENFRMKVPLYVDPGNGKMVRIGRIPCTGIAPTPIDVVLPIGKIAKVAVNVKNDILVGD